MTIRPEFSAAAIQRVAEPFGGDVHRTAAAILSVANVSMGRALRVVSVERGHDPRDFTLVAFGGAGPLHACDLAAALRIQRVLVPPHPGVISALGMATAPIVKELSAAVTESLTTDPSAARGRGGNRHMGARHDARVLARTRDELKKRGRLELEGEGFSLSNVTTQTFLEMRYAGQSYELSIQADSLTPGTFVGEFHAAHRDRYGHSDETRTVEIVTMRVKLIVPSEKVDGKRQTKTQRRRTKKDEARPPVRDREVWFDGKAASSAVYERTDLRAGATVKGPAVVVQMDSTTAVPPGWRGEVDQLGNLILRAA
jgi:N-methylhydantoinase A